MNHQGIKSIVRALTEMKSLGVVSVSGVGTTPWVQLTQEAFAVTATSVVATVTLRLHSDSGFLGDYLTGEFTMDNIRFFGIIRQEDLHLLQHTGIPHRAEGA